jgi:hypothetical protein
VKLNSLASNLSETLGSEKGCSPPTISDSSWVGPTEKEGDDGAGGGTCGTCGGRSAAASLVGDALKLGFGTTGKAKAFIDFFNLRHLLKKPTKEIEFLSASLGRQKLS